VIRNHLVLRDAALDPLHEWTQCNHSDLGRNDRREEKRMAFSCVRSGAGTTVPNLRKEEESSEFLCAVQSFILLSLIVSAVVSLVAVICS
jgi:hypothetical protein